LPIIGYPFGWAFDVLRLPLLMHRTRQLEAYSLGQNRKLPTTLMTLLITSTGVNDALAAIFPTLSAAITDLLEQFRIAG